MASYIRLHRISLVAALAGLLAGCSAFQPTPAPGGGRLGVPQPTATQIAVGANPTPSRPRINQFVTPVTPPGARAGGNRYGWLENVHSDRTRHWIAKENAATAKALAAIPQRAGIRSRLEQLRGASSDVVVERAFYLTPDGTRLPIAIAHRRDLARDGSQPTLLTVYRGAGNPPGRLLEPFVLVWAHMGGVYARAQVRDGLASGPASRAATLPDRSLALSDLFAAAQSLIDRHYTRRERLGIYGRGYGGMLAGAAVTLRPDFFEVALPTGTWPQYRQIATGNCFPSTLITTAEHDGNIRPWEGYELAAVLQANQICRRPILISVGSEEGPEESMSTRRERTADELAFAAKWLRVQPVP